MTQSTSQPEIQEDVSGFPLPVSAGDGAKRAASEAADDVKRTSDKMTQGVQWLTEKTRAVGGAISQGAQKARDAIAEAGRTIADLFNR